MFPARLPAAWVYRGDNPSLIADLQFNDDDDSPLDLSSYSWVAHWKSSLDATTYIALDIDESEANVGHLVVTASGIASQQMALSTLKGHWDLQSTVGGEVRTWVFGDTVIVKDVS